MVISRELCYDTKLDTKKGGGAMQQPLADAIRPQTLDDVVGQRHLLAPAQCSGG